MGLNHYRCHFEVYELGFLLGFCEWKYLFLGGNDMSVNMVIANDVLHSYDITTVFGRWATSLVSI